ncbi:IclR family transcriptional regulator [Paenibacillus elgii]|uniref:IclR family transcriptional regulator n=1 Tax=Paenibacillus elgii TaxID=189691 RepID=UPI002D7AD8B8|nr:IclR family transcriptional regulator [Paenibacillus elgii]
MSVPDKASDKGSLVAERTLKALLLFTEQKMLSVLEIATALEISQTAAYRIVHTLFELGFLKRGQEKKYMLDTVILKLADMVDSDLRSIATPIMKELMQEFNESIELSVSYNPLHYVIIEEIESSNSLKWTSPIGEPRSLYAGIGKTHLAFKGSKAVEELLNNTDLVPYTKNTITDVEQLKQELQTIQNCGYGISRGEHTEGVVGISVPIMDTDQKIAKAVLSTVIPDNRFREDQLFSYISRLQEAAKRIGAFIR